MSQKPAVSLPAIAALGKKRSVKLSLDPDVAQDLDLYMQAFEAAHGQKVSAETLIPHMLRSFIQQDSSFKKWKANGGGESA